MAARTSAATGNWNSTGTWTGGVVPVSGDTVTIQSSHTVTVIDSRTVGHSPVAGHATAAILVNNGGALTIAAAGTLIVRGDTKLDTAILTIAGVYEFDASAAVSPSTARYVCQIGTADLQTSKVIVAGTVGQRAIIRSNAGGANGRFTGGAFLTGGRFDANHVEMLRIGDATNDAIFTYMAWSANDICRIKNAVLDACGRISVASWAEPNTIWDLQNVTCKNSVGTQCVAVQFGTSIGTGTWRIDGCVFDKQVSLNHLRATPNANGVSITNTVFLETPVLSNPYALWSGNLLRGTAADSAITASAATSYLLMDQEHGLQLSWDGQSQVLDGWIIEYSGTVETGDCITIPAPSAASVYAIKNNLILANSVGGGSGTLFSALAGPNATILCDHNTAFVSGLSSGATVAETYAGHAGMLGSFTNNLFWGPATPSGYKLSSLSGSVSGIVATANADYNAGYRLLVGDGKSYKSLTPATGYGANDLDGTDPQFVDATRNLKTWDASIAGGAGSITHGLTELGKRNDATGYNTAYTIAALMAYVWAGFVPQAPELDAASDSVAPTNGWIGAVEGSAVAPPAAVYPIFRSVVIRGVG